MCKTSSHSHGHSHGHSHAESNTDVLQRAQANAGVSRRTFVQIAALSLASFTLGACGRRATAATVGVVRAGELAGFDGFRDRVKVLRDDRYFRIESDGMAGHAMMVGIRSWQQQVPLPQSYRGENAWRIPVTPKKAATPISARNALFRGAIAIAVDGVPIFNALNNRGADTLLAGELDDFGGHAGRADDYHYHTAPLHLQAQAGIGKPIAWALDGYPLFGLREPDGTPVRGLDEFNGHEDTSGRYHYHATTTYPYINGGLRGEVAVVEDQVEPQPRTTAVRPWLQPLRGAMVTGFQRTGQAAYALEYVLAGRAHQVRYAFADRRYAFEFVDADGGVRTEVYERRGD